MKIIRSTLLILLGAAATSANDSREQILSRLEASASSVESSAKFDWNDLNPLHCGKVGLVCKKFPYRFFPGDGHMCCKKGSESSPKRLIYRAYEQFDPCRMILDTGYSAAKRRGYFRILDT